MGKLIELDAAEKAIMQEIIALAKDNFYSEYRQSLIKVILPKIQSLPQIDIVGEIEKMIEENKEEAKRAKNSPLFEPIYGYAQVRGGVLHQLLQKFKS